MSLRLRQSTTQRQEIRNYGVFETLQSDAKVETANW
jgi:hypothetical protein